MHPRKEKYDYEGILSESKGELMAHSKDERNAPHAGNVAFLTYNFVNNTLQLQCFRIFGVVNLFLKRNMLEC